MSARTIEGRITGKVTCENGEEVPLTVREQTIISQLGQRLKSRDEVLRVLGFWEQRLLNVTTPHQIVQKMADILRSQGAPSSPLCAASVVA